MAFGSHHLYVHVPFCRLVCAYCDFVTVGGRSGDIAGYVAAVTAELALRRAPGELRTMYFGGGTPSLLTADQVATIVDAARAKWSRAKLDEVTLEANPSRREPVDWNGLREAGVTRISLGAQSLRDADLVALARGHDASEVREAVAAVRRAGFQSLSLDLIYGIPGQSVEDWREGLAAAIALAPDHLSCYALQLVLEPDVWAAPPRPGALRWRRRLAQAQDDGVAAAQYALAEKVLAENGYRHYELSSWAKPGHESRHNVAYWARRAYTGIGAGAHSYGGIVRSWNERDLDAYVACVRRGSRPVAGSETLDEPVRAFEAVALGLRRIDGLPRAAFASEFGTDPAERFADAVADGRERGLLELTADAMRLTARGRLMASEACIPFLPATTA